MSLRQEKQLLTSFDEDRRNFESKTNDVEAGELTAFTFPFVWICFKAVPLFFTGGDDVMSSEKGATGNK